MTNRWEKSNAGDTCPRPKCGHILEVLIDDREVVRKERCPNGCYEYDYELGKRVK